MFRILTVPMLAVAAIFMLLLASADAQVVAVLSDSVQSDSDRLNAIAVSAPTSSVYLPAIAPSAMDEAAYGSCEHGGSCSRWSCIGNRKTLTGDWFGRRTALAERGILYEASITQFYQGVASGGAEQIFRYGNKIDQFFTVDTKKLGLWGGGSVVIHVDTALGQNSILDAAAMAPANTAMTTPTSDTPVTAITNLQYNQEIKKGLVATIGKFNFIDLWSQFYPDYGRGKDGFMNISSIVFLNVAPTLPLIFDGAGFLTADERGITGALMVLDPVNIPTTSGLNPLFENGATILGIKRFFTEFHGLPGSHFFAGTWSSRDFTSFERSGWGLHPGDGLTIPTQTNSWLAAYVLDQTLWMDPCNKNRKTWLTSTWGVADKKTSAYSWMGTVSIESIGFNRSREYDRMGISYWYSGVSDDLKNLVAGPPLNVGLQDLQGGEFYYNYQVNPWFHVTGDFQAIQTEINSQDAAIVLGLRAKIDF